MEDLSQQLLTRCRRFNFKVTYYCSIHLKLHLGIPKRVYYENLLSVIINISQVNCSGTSKWAKLLQCRRSGSLIFWQGVTKLKFLVTYYSSNNLKLHMDTPKILFYKVMLVFITEFLVAGSSRAANFGKITMRSAVFPGSFSVKNQSLCSLIVVQMT